MTGNDIYPTSRVVVEHVEVPTALAYDDLIHAFERELGRLDVAAAQSWVAQKTPWSEVRSEIERMAGPRGLMIIYRADQGAITSLAGTSRRSSLYIVGNPVIANEIIGIDLRASFYVPFRVCVYDPGDSAGAVIGYDRPSSFLNALGRPELAAFGDLLDGKIDSLVSDLRNKSYASSASP
jgi:uncharacterized protein (DUF302 family)